MEEIVEVPLTQGKVALISKSDWPLVSRYPWYAHRQQYTWYARTNSGPSGSISLHRLILPGKALVDHIDRNGLNNTRENLRPLTQQSNTINSGKQRNNTSGYIGVDWSKQHKKFRARLKVDGSSHYLGLYCTAAEAAIAYDRAWTEWAGELGAYNF